MNYTSLCGATAASMTIRMPITQSHCAGECAGWSFLLDEPGSLLLQVERGKPALQSALSYSESRGFESCWATQSEVGKPPPLSHAQLSCPLLPPGLRTEA